MFFLFLLLDIHNSEESRDKGGPILTALYHFHLFHEVFDFNQAITVESSTLHIDSSRNQVYTQPLISTEMIAVFLSCLLSHLGLRINSRSDQ